MSDNYKFDADAIKEVVSFNRELITGLDNALKTAESLKKRVNTYSGWKGKQKEELMTFLSLLIKYHRDLIKQADAPFNLYKKAFDQLYNNIEDYAANSKSYKELNNK